MNRKRIGVVALLSAALFLLATDPVLAQSSINEELINSLNGRLLWVGVPITIMMEAVLFYTVWRYRNNDDPTPTRENRRLEITWTVATAVILLFVGLGSFLVMGSQFVAPAQDTTQVQAQQQIQPAVTNDTKSGAIAPTSPDAVQVEVDAYQWGWDFNYPTENVTSSNKIVIPANTHVYIHVTSRDVLHAVHVPALGLKQDAFPGQYNTIETNVSQTGTYQLYCAEYCGSGHSSMLANMTVMTPQNYQSWLGQQRSSGNTLSGNSSSSNSSSGNSSAGNSSSGESAAVAPVSPVSVRPA